jgi:hypothetical protein
MRIGDVVVAASERDPLHCGSGCYTHAIVVSLEPFALVSEEGDMLWTRREPYSVRALCQAHPDATRAAFERWQNEIAPNEELRGGHD